MTGPSLFTFEALRPDGGVDRGVVAAASREAAVASLRLKGTFPIAVREDSPLSRRRGPRPTLEETASGLRALSTLLEAELPVSRILGVLDGLVTGAWREALPAIEGHINQGDPLSVALERSQLGIPPHVLGLVRAGEAGGGLASAVSRAAQLMEQQAGRARDIRNALAYPIILAVAGSASVLLLIGVVLPRFADLLADAGSSLPALTTVVLLVGTGLLTALPFLFVVALGVAASFLLWIRNPIGRRRWHEILLRVPAVGEVRESISTSNSCATLAALLEAGVPVPTALPHAAMATGDLAIVERFRIARERLSEGTSLAASIGTERALSPLAVRLIAIGEETGRLSALVSHAADVEADRAQDRISQLTRLIEPAMIMVFGGLVFLVAAAVMQAMYGLTPSS